MIRFSVCAFFVVLSQTAQAAPVNYFFTGRASGTLGFQTFSNAEFEIEVSSDTLLVSEWVPRVWACPPESPSQITIGSLGTAVFFNSVGASVFYNQDVHIVGFWRYAGTDFLDLDVPLGAYDLKSSVGPIAGPNGCWLGGLQTSQGVLSFDSNTVTGTAFRAEVVPEPASWMALGLGAWMVRRRVRA